MMKQIKLLFNSIDKLNLYLIKTFTYLFQFALDVRHKLNKQHIVSNVLSRLLFNVESIKWTINLNFNVDEKTLNMIYHVILIKMSNEFKKKFKKTYKKNKRWIKIIKLLIKDSVENNSKNWINFENLRFKYCNNLVYYLNDNELNDDRERLCIFKKFVENIFVLIHDRLNYCDYHKTYNQIMISFYIKKFF